MSSSHFARLVAALAILSATMPAPAQDAPRLPVYVQPMDSTLRYLGRFDIRDPAGPRCAWSASTVQIRFHGTALNVRLAETRNDQYQIVVDGKPTQVLKPVAGTGLYSLASALPEGDHLVEMVKRTEPFVGSVQVLGFQLSAGGSLLKLPPRSDRRIEIVGDSITCGYGNEGASQAEHFSPSTENAYMSYGAIAARDLGADYFCVAWSGRKIWPDDTMDEVYGLILPEDTRSRWDAGRWTPNVVVINLGTNDFGKANPDRKGWTEAYEKFISRLLSASPKAEIYCATGSMMSDAYPAGQNALSTLKSYIAQIVDDEHRAGHSRVHELDFAQQDSNDGLGSDFHPSVKTHQIMAAKLETVLQTDLGWKPAQPSTK